MKKLLIFTILLLVTCACSSNKKETDNKKDMSDHYELTDYVYIDRTKCLHTSKDCLVLTYGFDEGEQPNYQVKFIETKNLTENDFASMCSKCVSSKSFKKLRNIIESNNILNVGYEEENDSAM